MDTFMILFGLGLALMTAGPALLILVWAIRRSGLWAFLAAAATAAGVVWWIELYRALTSAGDLGGMFDCYPDCSASQDAAWAILGYLPVLIAVVLVSLLLAGVIRRVRRSRPADLGQARAGL